MVSAEADIKAERRHLLRQDWTQALVQVVKQANAQRVVVMSDDSAEDVAALAAEGITATTTPGGPGSFASVINEAEVVSVIDQLDQQTEPEAYLGQIAQTMRVGGVLVEASRTYDFDAGGLPENRGWHTGRVLDRWGFQKLGERGDFRIWQRVQSRAGVETALLICAYRSICLPTVSSLMKLIASNGNDKFGWRIDLDGEAGLNRARSGLVTRWFTQTSSDVFLMVDDDMVFGRYEAEHVVELCRGAQSSPSRDRARSHNPAIAES